MTKQIRNRKKIMMISSVHVWFDTRIFFKEAMSLSNNNFKIDFYAIEAENNKIKYDKNIDLDINILKHRSRFMRWIYWIKFYKLFINSSAYFLHIHDFELLFVAKSIKKKLNDEVFIVYDMHEHIPSAIKTKNWIPKKVRGFISKKIENKEKELMNYCDEIIYAELSYKKNYSDLNISSIDILNYPIYLPKKFSISQSSPYEKFTLIYVGALIEQRGLYEMIDLIDELVNKRKMSVQLKLIGQINENSKKINSYISKKKLSNCIHLLGRKPYSKIWRYYSSSDLGLCLLQPTPNNLNSQSTKLFEYMAAGLPFISSNFPAFHEICKKFNCGVDFDPKNINSMADFITEIMANEDIRKKMGENGINAYKNNFNWQVEERKLVNLYEDKVN